jgi:hypothetical protein
MNAENRHDSNEGQWPQRSTKGTKKTEELAADERRLKTRFKPKTKAEDWVQNPDLFFSDLRLSASSAALLCSVPFVLLCGHPVSV